MSQTGVYKTWGGTARRGKRGVKKGKEGGKGSEGGKAQREVRAQREKKREKPRCITIIHPRRM